MQTGQYFTSLDVELNANRLGIPNARNHPVAMRFADRLIQNERKAGRIKRLGKGWVKK